MFDYAVRGELLIAYHDRVPFAKAERWSPIRVPFASGRCPNCPATLGGKTLQGTVPRDIDSDLALEESCTSGLSVLLSSLQDGPAGSS